jgi:hypothetical protein
MQERYPSPCVGSGMCCKRSPCAFGEYDHEAHQCRFLEVAKVVDGVEIYGCGRYELIRQQPGANWNPAFGSGCCQALFNDNRERIIAIVGEGSPTRAAIALERPMEDDPLFPGVST